MLQVLVDGGVEVFGVALVQTVDLSLLLDLHIPLGQDELTDGLMKKKFDLRVKTVQKMKNIMLFEETEFLVKEKTCQISNHTYRDLFRPGGLSWLCLKTAQQSGFSKVS